MQSADALDESELSLWNGDPPYDQPGAADTFEEACFTRNLVDVMFGHRMRLEQQCREARMRMYEAKEEGAVVDTLEHNITGVLTSWASLK
ncbi:hypothetical protein V8E55_006442 [Tylopilus felleus]